MGSLNIDIPHQLPKQEAVERIKKLLGRLKTEQKDQIKNVKEEWHGDKGSFEFTSMGFDISGLISVNENNVNVNGNLPFALSLFKGKISNVITQKAKELLS
jgi:hypothetical protein